LNNWAIRTQNPSQGRAAHFVELAVHLGNAVKRVAEAIVAQLHQTVDQFVCIQMCAGAQHGVEQSEQMHHNFATHGVMQKSCRQQEWVMRGGNPETTASAANMDFQHVVELRSPGQTTRTAVVTSRSRVVTTSCDHGVVGGPKQ